MKTERTKEEDFLSEILENFQDYMNDQAAEENVRSFESFIKEELEKYTILPKEHASQKSPPTVKESEPVEQKAAETHAKTMADTMGWSEPETRQWIVADFTAGANWQKEREKEELTRALARIEELEKDNAELLDTVLDLFSQGCSCTDGKYDHFCLSSYESAQSLLIERGVIKKEDCYRE